MDQALCTFCQTPSPVLFRVRDLNRRITGEIFTYYRCPECRLVFLSPHPVDLGRYYPDDFHTIPTSLEQTEQNSRGDLFKLEAVQKYVNSGRLLEVGSSYGGFAYLSKKAGFDVDVVEMDARCCEFLANVVGVRAINAVDPVEALKSLGGYDVIALWQVVEHLPEPWVTLQSLAAHLNPGGILILAAPNPDSLQFRLLGKRWPHVDAPRHLSLIPVSLLRSCSEKFRLKLVEVSTNDPGSRHWNHFGWQVGLSNLVNGAGAKHRMRWIGTQITRAVSSYEERGLHGSTYTVIFQKPG